MNLNYKKKIIILFLYFSKNNFYSMQEYPKKEYQENINFNFKKITNLKYPISFYRYILNDDTFKIALPITIVAEFFLISFFYILLKYHKYNILIELLFPTTCSAITCFACAFYKSIKNNYENYKSEESNFEFLHNKSIDLINAINIDNDLRDNILNYYNKIKEKKIKINEIKNDLNLYSESDYYEKITSMLYAILKTIEEENNNTEKSKIDIEIKAFLIINLEIINYRLSYFQKNQKNQKHQNNQQNHNNIEEFINILDKNQQTFFFSHIKNCKKLNLFKDIINKADYENIINQNFDNLSAKFKENYNKYIRILVHKDKFTKYDKKYKENLLNIAFKLK